MFHYYAVPSHTTTETYSMTCSKVRAKASTESAKNSSCDFMESHSPTPQTQPLFLNFLSPDRFPRHFISLGLSRREYDPYKSP